MHKILRLLPLLALSLLAGCGSSVQTTQFAQGPVVTGQPVQTAMPQTNPAQQTANAMAMTDVQGFINPEAAALMSENSRSQALGAQFNSLQFGRPGAPRNWQGDNGASGKVTVGAPITVNTLYCRSFTHEVTIAGKTYSRNGTACREQDGRWIVESSTG